MAISYCKASGADYDAEDARERFMDSIGDIGKAQDAYNQGKKAFFSGNFEVAERYFLEASHHNKHWALPHSFLGQIYLEHYQNPNKAIYHLEKATRGSSYQKYQRFPLYYLALSYEQIGKDFKALITWKKLLQVCDQGSERMKTARRHIQELESHRKIKNPHPTP